MRYLKLFLMVGSMFFLVGCAANIKYSMNDSKLHCRQEPLNYRVAVDVLEDERPIEECDGSLHRATGSEVIFTKDEDFKPDIHKQVSGMLAEHLNKARIFRLTEVRDVDNNLDTNIQEMEMLKADGVDLVILGKIHHFYGYQTPVNAAVSMFGLVGALTEMVANPKKVGANVEYGDIKIIDLGNQGILWQGDISHDFEEQDIFYDGQVAYSLRALKETNNKLAMKLSEVVPER